MNLLDENNRLVASSWMPRDTRNRLRANLRSSNVISSQTCVTVNLSSLLKEISIDITSLSALLTKPAALYIRHRLSKGRSRKLIVILILSFLFPREAVRILRVLLPHCYIRLFKFGCRLGNAGTFSRSKAGSRPRIAPTIAL